MPIATRWFDRRRRELTHVPAIRTGYTRRGAARAFWCLMALPGCTAGPPTDAAPDVVASVPAGPYVPGRSYAGRNGWIEYLAGDAPIIYSAPHGGTLLPDEIPDRTAAACGGEISSGGDRGTADLARRIQRAHHARHGTWPHVVIANLHRRRLDANRPLGEGACGDADAAGAWREWHAFLAIARRAVSGSSARGWYVDLHGHGHARARLELGWLLDGAQLRLADSVLDATPALEDSSSIAELSRRSPLSFSALLRGPTSLGTLFEEHGYLAVPSSGDPAPAAGEPFFRGGDNTRRYACGPHADPQMPGGIVCGVQIEAHLVGVRDTEAARQRFAEATVTVMDRFLAEHWPPSPREAPR